MSKRKRSSAVEPDVQVKLVQTVKPETLEFMGVERSYADVFEHYEMMRDAYFHYKSHECRHMTESKRLYVISFKRRVDDMAKLLGLNTEMTLPDNIDRITKKNTEEDE